MTNSTEEQRRYHREYFRRRYRNDPEFRENTKRRSVDPAAVAKANARKTERYRNDPEYRARVLAQGRKFYNGRSPEQKEAKRKKLLVYHSKRRADPEAKAKMAEYARRHREIFRIKHLVRTAILRAKKNGLECDREYMKTVAELRPITCPCCKRQLEYAYSGKLHHPLINGPSLDRIDTTKGYIAGNIDIICWRCNAIKRDATLMELETIVRYMREHLLCKD
jgi:hypothetical protein